MEEKKNIILSIETAAGGGSLTLYRDEAEIDRWAGAKDVSKAEDILEQISDLLKKNKIEKKQIRSINVSSRSGSLTGTKICLAIAKGLSSALAIEVVENSISDK